MVVTGALYSTSIRLLWGILVGMMVVTSNLAEATKQSKLEISTITRFIMDFIDNHKPASDDNHLPTKVLTKLPKILVNITAGEHNYPCHYSIYDPAYVEELKDLIYSQVRSEWASKKTQESRDQMMTKIKAEVDSEKRAKKARQNEK